MRAAMDMEVFLGIRAAEWSGGQIRVRVCKQKNRLLVAYWRDLHVHQRLAEGGRGKGGRVSSISLR